MLIFHWFERARVGKFWFKISLKRHHIKRDDANDTNCCLPLFGFGVVLSLFFSLSFHHHHRHYHLLVRFCRSDVLLSISFKMWLQPDIITYKWLVKSFSCSLSLSLSLSLTIPTLASRKKQFSVERKIQTSRQMLGGKQAEITRLCMYIWIRDWCVQCTCFIESINTSLSSAVLGVCFFIVIISNAFHGFHLLPFAMRHSVETIAKKILSFSFCMANILKFRNEK